MKLGINEFTTVTATFAEDVAAYAAAGADGIGLCEAKLDADDGAARAALREAGLAVGACVPSVPSILPLPLMEGPDDPSERIAALEASVERLARFEPACVLFLTGPGDDRRDVVLEGIRAVADAGERHGVPVALEPVWREYRELWSIPTSLDEAADLLEEAGRPHAGLLLDTWHLGGLPDLAAQVARHRDRILGVHVADRREPTRSTNDRVLPGDGTLDLRGILAELAWEGLHELEIFSDPELPGSLWREEPASLARRGLAALRGVVPA